MANTIIISLCTLLLIAYLFDISATKTKIPSVILLLLLGIGLKFFLKFLAIELPDFSGILPVLGTIGLILIVLEGSLELELEEGKKKLILSSVLGSLFGIISLSVFFTLAISEVTGCGLKTALTNVLPFCVISSAVAIPTVKNLKAAQREYIIYESSLSDIFGVILFNFVALNQIINLNSFANFGLQLLAILLLSLVATLMLSYLLNKISHHIKFLPIIILVILIYSIAKIYHLPALLFILIFGLFIGNLKLLYQYSWVEKFKPQRLAAEVLKFKELNTEIAFLIRALFFILFGYLIEMDDIMNPETILWAIAIVSGIFLFRFIQLKFSGVPVLPLLFVAPRGLITILLYLSIDSTVRLELVSISLVTQIILISGLVMMLGMMLFSKPNKGIA